MNEILISVDVAAAQLVELVEAIHARGHTVVLTKNGLPLARLVPLPELHSPADVANFVRSNGSEPPLPAAVDPSRAVPLEPPLPESHREPPLPEPPRRPPLPEFSVRPPLPPRKETRIAPESHGPRKKFKPEYLVLSIIMAGLGGVTLILIVALIVRFALFAPAPIPLHQEKRPAVRDTSQFTPRDRTLALVSDAADSHWAYRARHPLRTPY